MNVRETKRRAARLTRAIAQLGALLEVEEAKLEEHHKRIRESKPIRRCQASRGDGECNDGRCPQRREGEPERSGRSCPLPWGDEETS